MPVLRCRLIAGFGCPPRQPIAARNVFKNDKAFGVDRTEVYDGLDFTMNARFNNGSRISGGYNLGRTVDDQCYVVNSPQEMYQCRVVTPIAGNQQVKFIWSYPLPYGLAVSGVVQNIPGVAIQATTTFTNDQIAPSLGRNLSRCPAPTGPCSGITVALPLLEPNALYEERLTQVDLRLLKNFVGDWGRFRVTFDLYNLFNASTVLARNNTYGLGGEILAGCSGSVDDRFSLDAERGDSLVAMDSLRGGERS